MDAKEQFLLADRLYKERRYAEAADILAELNRQYPDNKNLMFSFAQCLYRLNRHTEALTLCEDLIARFNHPRASEMRQTILSAQASSVLTDPAADQRARSDAIVGRVPELDRGESRGPRTPYKRTQDQSAWGDLGAFLGMTLGYAVAAVLWVTVIPIWALIQGFKSRSTPVIAGTAAALVLVVAVCVIVARGGTADWNKDFPVDPQSEEASGSTAVVDGEALVTSWTVFVTDSEGKETEQTIPVPPELGIRAGCLSSRQVRDMLVLVMSEPRSKGTAGMASHVFDLSIAVQALPDEYLRDVITLMMVVVSGTRSEQLERVSFHAMTVLESLKDRMGADFMPFLQQLASCSHPGVAELAKKKIEELGGKTEQASASTDAGKATAATDALVKLLESPLPPTRQVSNSVVASLFGGAEELRPHFGTLQEAVLAIPEASLRDATAKVIGSNWKSEAVADWVFVCLHRRMGNDFVSTLRGLSKDGDAHVRQVAELRLSVAEKADYLSPQPGTTDYALFHALTKAGVESVQNSQGT